jgi:cytochrome c-type biogenesis protein CcmH/NrfF
VIRKIFWLLSTKYFFENLKMTKLVVESSQKFRESNTVHVDSYDDLISTLNDKPGFVSCYWHENSEQEDEVKNLTKGTLRCYVIDNEKLENSVNEPSQKGKLAIFSKAY